MLKPTILVTNATGKTGFATVCQLLEVGYPIRALVRRRNSRAIALEQSGAELFIGDLSNTADLNRAMLGVQRAYLCIPPAPNVLFQSIPFAVAAADARLEVVVMMSQWLSHSQHPAIATRGTWLAERILGLMPNIDTAIINPGWFADNYMSALESIAQLGIMPMPLGAGLNAPPSNEDIARVVVGALTDPASHIGKTYRPTGSQLLSPEEIAAIYAKVLNRPVKYLDISEKMFIKAMTAQGFSPFLQSQLRYYAEEYLRNAFGIGGVTNAVEEVSGQQSEDFETIVRRYVSQSAVVKPSPANKLKAIWNFLRIVLTPVPDLDGYEKSLNHSVITQAAYAPDFNTWMDSHAWDGMGATFWIPSVIVPALLVTHYIIFLILLRLGNKQDTGDT